MTWADACIAKLGAGQIAQCRPHGGSMRGRIESGQLVTLDPAREPSIDDAVLCRCRGNVYVHLIKAVRGHGEQQRFLIGNNHGGINGWISRSAVHGVVIGVSD